jgi:hypothetical protein
MQWLLGTYSQWYNKKHKRSGHLFGDRFHSFLIDKDAYMSEVIRYVVLNPVRAKMVERPELYHPREQRTVGRPHMPRVIETVARLAVAVRQTLTRLASITT